MTDVSGYDWPHTEPFSYRRDPDDVVIVADSDDLAKAYVLSGFDVDGNEVEEELIIHRKSES